MNNVEISENLNRIQECLSHLRTKDEDARRRTNEDEDLIIKNDSPYRMDADYKIGPSKAFRRLPYKTQVVTHPRNVHVRSRASHTEEVTSIAVLMAHVLGFNVSLARAIAKGHDIGHTPFGHIGEEFLSDVTGKPFRHEIFGVVLAQKIERLGNGLNLTHQTLEGMRLHSRGFGEISLDQTQSPEASVVMFADKFAYTTGDYNDFKRFQLNLKSWDKLHQVMRSLGETQRERVNNLAASLCLESEKRGFVSFCQSKESEIFSAIRKEMSKIYPIFNIHQSKDVMARIYEFIKKIIDDVDPAIALALMTDNDVMHLASKNVLDITSLMETTLWEILPILQGRQIDWSDPDLDW